MLRLPLALSLGLFAACASTPTPVPAEPVAAAPAASAAPEESVVSAVEADTIAAAAVADIDPSFKSVEDVRTNETADDPDDLPPAPTKFGASLVELRVDADGDPESLWVSAKHARVHSGPSSKTETVGSLIQGDRIEVLERDGGFVRIGDDQWVSSRDLTVKQKAPQEILAH